MRGIHEAVSDDNVASREVVSKTSAYNITKLSYRVEVRVSNIQSRTKFIGTT